MTDAIGLDLLETNAEQDAIAQARAEERRKSAIQLVNSIYRLIKVLGIHAESNQAVAVLVDGTVEAVREYCERAASATASVLFADDTLFVNGQMLRASRDTYATAVALGALFHRCGISEVTFQSSLDASQAMGFARALHAALRDRSLAATTVDQVIPGVKLRRIDGRAKDGEDLEEVSIAERVAKTYAASIVIMRAFHRELASGQYHLPHRIKRVAQKLVKDAEDAPHVLLGLAMARAPGSDEAQAAVGSAALSVLIARQLTGDRAMLGNLATTALLFDVGRKARTTSQEGALPLGIARVLNEDELDRLPAKTAAVLTVLGRMHAASITRTVVTFEALWARRAARLGPLYGGRRTPTLLARILATARTFIELVTPTPMSPALPIDDAVNLLMEGAETEIDRACAKLLVASLGFFPVGTVVELNTGELGIVTAVPRLAAHFARPPIRLMYGEGGNLLREPLDLDLAEPERGQPLRYVRRTVEYDAQQMRAMRSFILDSVAGKRKAQHPALLQPPSEPAAKAIPAEAPRNRRMPLPRPASEGAAPPSSPATRQVSWDEYQKLATPKPHTMAAPSAISAHEAKPSGPATRQVDWDEYQKLATPKPHLIANPPSEPAPKASGPATRQVNWDEYQKLATPKPHLIASPPREPAPLDVEVSWDEPDEPTISSPEQPPFAATRQVNWSDYQALESAPLELSPWPDELPPEQDDTDLLLAGVEQEEEVSPDGSPPAEPEDLEAMFKSYLADEEPTLVSSPPPAMAPKPGKVADSMRPVSPTPTRHMRWAATEALLDELEDEARQSRPPPVPPRPDPKRK